MGTARGTTVLVVEDEAIIALAEKLALEDQGYRVVVAYSGEAALELTAGGVRFDLVLMDVTLGTGMDGVETARIILACREVPILFLSSLPLDEIRRRTKQLKRIRHICKPCSTERLVKAIRSVTDASEPEREEVARWMPARK